MLEQLIHALVESKLATSANARADNAHDPGLFTVSASCEPENLDKVREVTLKVMENLGTTPFTAEEVEQAALTEREIFVELQAIHVAQHLRDLRRKTALQHFRVRTETAIPRLQIHRHFGRLENVEDLRCPGGIRAVIEADGDLPRTIAEVLHGIRERQGIHRLGGYGPEPRLNGVIVVHGHGAVAILRLAGGLWAHQLRRP